jgi:hypothetical protein
MGPWRIDVHASTRDAARNFAHRAGPILDLGDAHLAFLAHLIPASSRALRAAAASSTRM